MNKIKYADVTDLNNDQVDLLKSKGYSFFTECDEGGESYYNKNFSWANRIGYLVFESEPEEDYFNSYKELSKVAEFDEDFNEEVHELINPIKDECYLFYLENSDKNIYTFNQVWTNKGVDKAKEIAKDRYYAYPTCVLITDENREYYENKVHDARRQIDRNRNDVKRILKENGFEISGDYTVKRCQPSNEEVKQPISHPIKIWEFLKANDIYIDNFYVKCPDIYIGVMLGMVACGKLTRNEYHDTCESLETFVKKDKDFRESGQGIDLELDYDRLLAVIKEYKNKL